ncbi:MAG: glycosyl transferase family 28, partial [Nocardioidaceae bacterium]|nr:glycosyl transferase family 28 [Nocardioidaceae bacterium]
GWSDAVRAKVRYTGYLGAGRERLLPKPTTDGRAPSVRARLRRPYVLALVGGGQDGAALADAFARATFPAGHDGVLVTGPYLPAAARRSLADLARSRGDLRVFRFVGDVPALARASRATVSMGGYNAVCELVSARRPVLVVPRVVPRREQALRAEHFADHGLLDVLAPDRLDPDRLGAWLRSAVAVRRRAVPKVDLTGLRRVPALTRELVDALEPGGAVHVG